MLGLLKREFLLVKRGSWPDASIWSLEVIGHIGGLLSVDPSLQQAGTVSQLMSAADRCGLNGFIDILVNLRESCLRLQARMRGRTSPFRRRRNQAALSFINISALRFP
jgi:hypothetical protein